MNKQELIKQAIESAKCRIYKLNFDTNKELSAHHQRKAENQKELMEITVEALERMSNAGDGWIPCSERLPSERGKYLVTGVKGAVYMAEFVMGAINEKPIKLWYRVGGTQTRAIAWMPLPEPYKGE